MRKLAIIFAVLSLLALSACGESAVIKEPAEVLLSCGSFPVDTETLSAVITEEDIALLDSFTSLRYADFSGSECIDAILSWHSEHPDTEILYTFTLPDGTLCDNHLSALDLSAMSREAAQKYIPFLHMLPELNSLRIADESAENGFTPEEAAAFAVEAPLAVLDYSFELYSMPINAADELLNLSHFPVPDNGDAVCTALTLMHACSYVDMDTCGIDNERMAEIRDAFPDKKVVWRINFGTLYSVRTDVTTILASSIYLTDQLTPENTTGLQYCTDVTHLDLGHNPDLTDISFVASMPKLQVLILALDAVEDISPLANCPMLEYAELYFTKLVDVSPLAGLKNLRHLNIGGNKELCDISPLYGLTELERLWIGRYDPVPEEQIALMQAAAPNCEINLTSWDPMDDGWRYLSFSPDVRAPRYEQLREEFHYSDGLSAYSYSFNDPLY